MTPASCPFDEAVLTAIATRIGGATAAPLAGPVAPLDAEDLTRLPALGTPERRRLREAGREMVRAGEIGVVILAGGMATRFGGGVKAVLPALDGRSFLQLKLDDLAALGASVGADIPTFLMSSFATHDALHAHLAALGRSAGIEVFSQGMSLRLTPEGSLFRSEDGSLSPYATGHGDLPSALRESGALRRFREAGGTTLLMANVDNLGATLDPALLALHRELGGEITVEVVRKEAGDAGGAPARVGGVAQVVEGFRFPPDFDQDRIPVFNTNTFWLDAAAIDRDFDLPFHRVQKRVGGRPVIQFERMVGELTARLPTRFVEVPREGEDGRFLPAKEPAELQRRQADIARVARSERSLRG